MTSQPLLTDRAALARHRSRAEDTGMFLHRTAMDEVQDRLELVNKSFTAPVVITGFPGIWSGICPSARVVSDTETLALEQGAHDLAIHAMALHWANDPVGQLIQCRRALRADGLFLCAAFGGQTLHELRACLAQAEAEIVGGLSPRIAPMAELRDLGGLLQRAGYALPVADVVPLHVEYADAWALMRDLRQMGEGNALQGRLRHPTRRSVLAKAAALYQQHFGTQTGRITATFELVFLTGWAPDESQQKPLRPGSAQQRLADALRTDETKLRN
ncbi:methyltransferase domain-containing protein [Sulfitobacter aestuarii]|uniref:Methyltransferase domain-containing protein n=1 Tax=Sulfitobacter aestuarii TaxID=2161676 RepID=A0ABW5TXP0_9RHOB